jgi:hypothetical protein
LVGRREDSGQDMLEQVRQVLLQEVASRLPDNPNLCSALMGVTLPTFRRWMAENRPLA